MAGLSQSGMNRKLAAWLVCLMSCVSFAGLANEPDPANFVKPEPPAQGEGKFSTATIIVGPFDLHRKYRSMEGPYCMSSLRIGDLLASPVVSLTEDMITFIEGGSGSSMNGGPSMSGGGQFSAAPKGLVDSSSQPRELIWFKGLKLEVLDENDQSMPDAEFICHLNVDVDPAHRQRLFPEMQQSGTSRILTITQGQTDFQLPEGFGVPVASDELWAFTFQAANRTANQHRRIKHRCIISFIRDKDLVYPIKALHWYNPYITVTVDKNAPAAVSAEHQDMPNCIGTSAGVNAPNSAPGSVFSDKFGRRVSGHWVVPPGAHTYSSPIGEDGNPGFGSKDAMIHAAWTHIHPLCTRTSLMHCAGDSRKEIFTVKAKTKTEGGLQLEQIESVTSREGIPLPGNQRYELEATYENPTGSAQDSMVALGIFVADNNFARPDWCLAGSNSAYCGIKSDLPEKSSAVDTGESAKTQVTSVQTSAASNTTSAYPLFDASVDGPLLSKPKKFEIETTAGKLHLILDPTLAPKHATQLYRLFKNGVFDGTPIYRFQPNFVLQTSTAETKSGGGAISEAQRQMLRRLPLEVESQSSGVRAHKKWVLSMARWDAEDSAVSSFSIMLADAPHLDKKYTVFGRLVPDQVTTHTIGKIAKEWNKHDVRILEATELTPN
jgi:cyclophilin family peptidyl-prolyl cis-trans isomerase